MSHEPLTDKELDELRGMMDTHHTMSTVAGLRMYATIEKLKKRLRGMIEAPQRTSGGVGAKSQNYPEITPPPTPPS